MVAAKQKYYDQREKEDQKLQNKLLEQRKHIQFLEKKVNALSKKYDELQDECVICQEYLFTNRYEAGEFCNVVVPVGKGKKTETITRQLTCDHTQFHKQCLTDWFGNHQRCPLCNIKAK